MIRILCHCRRFNPNIWPNLQGNYQLGIDWHDLLWASISVGKLGYDDLMAHGQFSFDEIRFRSYLIYSHLMQRRNRIIKSTLYESLDSTEKGAASYFIGMAVSKLVGAFLLNVPWLVHLEKIKALFPIVLQGKSRPDLLGVDSQGKWVVFEAKGRTRGFSYLALRTAKTQTKQLRRISGQKPVLKVATESYFNPFLCVDVIDPKGNDEQAIDLEMDWKQFYSSYYSLFLNLFSGGARQTIVNYQGYRFVEDELTGLSVGMNQTMLNRLENEDLRPKDIQDFSINVGKTINQEKRNFKYFLDGIVISLDERLWGSQIMSLEPSERIEKTT